MTLAKDEDMVVTSLCEDVRQASSTTKRLKLRTLLSKFGYAKRSSKNTTEITHLLTMAGLTINPPIIPLDDIWVLSPDDWIYLSLDTQEIPKSSSPISTWNADGWFDRLADLDLRNEKEVETKFIIPLLSRLGYEDADRRDGVSIPAPFGIRTTRLVIDFALYNSSHELLRTQPLLIVEAKREGRLVKQREIIHAHNQARSYCYWCPCDFFMISDGQMLQVYRTSRAQAGNPTPIYECKRNELSNNFRDLFACISKEALTHHYLNMRRTMEEVR